MSPETALALSLLIPFVGALWVVASGRVPNLRDGGTVAVTFATFAAVTQLVPAVLAGQRPRLDVLTVFAGLELAFEVEPLGMIFGLVASSLWIVTSIYAFGYMRAHRERHQTRFFTCFAIAIGAALGIAFSANLFTLFLFYELLTFSTYPLVTHHGTPEAMRAGRTYLGILVSTSIAFLLLAIGWTWKLAGTLEFANDGILAERAGVGTLTLLLALYAFGIGKAALMPVHRWLPAAMVAPTPVSALLHAVAVVKAGVFSVLKIVVYVFGIDNLRSISESWLGANWLVVASCFTILAASLVALQQDNLKRRLAYSTVSQLSYIVLAAALVNQMGVTGGALHIVTHACGKITLFFCAGAFYVAAHKTEVSDMAGLGRRMPLTMFAFLLGSLSIIGLPPFAGALSKWYLLLAALEDERLWVAGVLGLSSLLNIAYLLPIPMRGFFSAPPAGEEGNCEARWMVTVPLLLTAIACLVLFLHPEPFVTLATSIGGK